MKISDFRARLISAGFYGANIISRNAVAYHHADGNIVRLRERGFQITEEYPHPDSTTPNAFIVKMTKRNMELIEKV